MIKKKEKKKMRFNFLRKDLTICYFTNTHLGKHRVFWAAKKRKTKILGKISYKSAGLEKQAYCLNNVILIKNLGLIFYQVEY